MLLISYPESKTAKPETRGSKALNSIESPVLTEWLALVINLPLTQAQLLTFLTDTQTLINNYLAGHNGLITWITSTFPTRSYYNNIPTTGANQGATIKTSLLAILSG